MEPHIRARFSPSILHRASRLYGIAEGSLRELDGFESFIYEARIAGQEVILRLCPSSRRSPALIEGEVDWISFLADNGVSAPRALPSAAGRMVECIDDGHGGQFLTTAFVRAAGRPPWELELGPDYLERYGSLLGRLHALAKQYEPPPGHGLRPQWTDSSIQDTVGALPASESSAARIYWETVERVRALPAHRDSYGLIHYDAHEANLLVDDRGSITIFDFDDCCYSYFVYDIAIVLLHASVAHQDKAAFLRRFLPPFLRGYGRENRLHADWLEELPLFLKLREIDLYAVIHRAMDVDNLDDWWCEQFMSDRKNRIEQGLDYVEFDFKTVAECL